jgi:hypothetical protein
MRTFTNQKMVHMRCTVSPRAGGRVHVALHDSLWSDAHTLLLLLYVIYIYKSKSIHKSKSKSKSIHNHFGFLGISAGFQPCTITPVLPARKTIS